jgi:predicted permease
MTSRDRWPSRRDRHGVDEEVDGELAFHLEMRRRELMAQGLSREQAERAALERFGDYERARLRMRAIGHQREHRRRLVRVAGFLMALGPDVRFAIRQMRAAPAFSLIAIATLAVGIGATTAIFGVVEAVVLRPLPVPEPHRLMFIGETWPDADLPANVSAGNFVDLAAEQTAFGAVAASVTSSMTLGLDNGAERVLGTRATGRYFEVFGVAPMLGRAFGPEDDEPGRDQVVVLSHRFWSGQFGAAPDILGHRLLLDGRPYAVIGVMPAAFDFTEQSESLWVPIAFTPERRAMHDEHFLDAYGRLRPDATIGDAASQLDAIGRRLAERFPMTNGGRTLATVPMMDVFIAGHRQRLLVLFGAVGLVLLIACGNVSNLLLARGTARARELAMRAALGAGRARLIRQLLAESLALGMVSTLVGVALAAGFVRLLVVFAPPGVPRLEQAELDLSVLGFSVLLALVTSLLFGVAPAWRAARTDVVTTLKEALRGAGARGPRDLVRSTLVAGEVALALMLLAGAGLLARSAVEMQRLTPGFNPEGVFSARFSLPDTRYGDAGTLMGATRAIEEAIAALPGVQSAAVSNAVPGWGGFYNGLLPEGEARDPRNLRDSRARFVTPDYFETMQVPLLRGRAFTDADRDGAELVMIVNRTLADRLFPGQDALGRRVDCCTGGPKVIVGIAGDVRALGPAEPIEPEFYLPLAQLEDVAWSWTGRSLFVVARTVGEPAALGAPIRRTISSVDAGVPVFGDMPMTTRLAETIDTERFNMGLLVTLSAVGLGLAAVGIFGVIAYFAAQRTSEIGIRIALGATRGSVVRLMLRQVAVPVLSGLVLGTLGAVFASKLIAAELVNVSPTDVPTYLTVVATLLGVALLAAIVPARRAASLDPARTLTAS